MCMCVCRDRPQRPSSLRPSGHRVVSPRGSTALAERRRRTSYPPRTPRAIFFLSGGRAGQMTEDCRVGEDLLLLGVPPPQGFGRDRRDRSGGLARTQRGTSEPDDVNRRGVMEHSLPLPPRGSTPCHGEGKGVEEPGSNGASECVPHVFLPCRLQPTAFGAGRLTYLGS